MEFCLFGQLTMTQEPSLFKAAHTIIEDLPYLMVCTTYFREFRLLRSRQTNLVMLAYVWNLLSSEKINVFYFSGSISKYAEHHFFRFRICAQIKIVCAILFRKSTIVKVSADSTYKHFVKYYSWRPLHLP